MDPSRSIFHIYLLYLLRTFAYLRERAPTTALTTARARSRPTPHTKFGKIENLKGINKASDAFVFEICIEREVPEVPVLHRNNFDQLHLLKLSQKV